jgi:hypothetical protein
MMNFSAPRHGVFGLKCNVVLEGFGPADWSISGNVKAYYGQ